MIAAPPDAAARQAAYRRLAINILGLDVQALTAELRARRQPVTPPLHRLPPSRKAA